MQLDKWLKQPLLIFERNPDAVILDLEATNRWGDGCSNRHNRGPSGVDKFERIRHQIGQRQHEQYDIALYEGKGPTENHLGLALLRSEEHTSELQSHSFISYAVFCLKKKK